MKRFIITFFLAMFVMLVLFAIEVEGERRAFNELYVNVSEDVKASAKLKRFQIADEKATAIIQKEAWLDFTRDKYIQKRERDEAKSKAEAELARKRLEANRQPNYPGGGHLTPSGGVYYYGNQRETYYNLDMSWVVSYARYNGIGGEYWIRSDGCKMLGDYIILACNRDIHPYGSIVETSLGLGISLDTGGFAYDYPYGVDIAVNW